LTWECASCHKSVTLLLSGGASVDEAVFLWFNSWNGSSDFFTTVIPILETLPFKTLPYMLVFWGLWFLGDSAEKRTEVREALTAALLCTVPIMLITRGIANYAPFSYRPMQKPGFEISVHEGQRVDWPGDFSSMPSDHASLLLGFSIAIFTIHRSAGTFLILWAIFISSIPRIILGYHWPSDILVGWLIGAAIALMLMRPLTRLVARTGTVPFFERREMLGYPLLFFASVEFVRLFDASRTLAEMLLS
jgi:undecaprenyl-diphosphatase